MPSTYDSDVSKKDDQIDMSAPNWLPDRPFNDLPRLPPEAELETKGVLKLCIRARAALAELKRAALLIPNQGMLINTLPLLEAQASSEIENVVTTADELFRALPDSPENPAVREALRDREAVLDGYRMLSVRPLGTVLAEAVVSRIKGVRMGVRRHGGTVLKNSVTGETVYTPPQGESLLRDLLANWEWFLHEATETDPLVRMAVGHYQFEAIHPFSDGNGRAGRILNSLFLIETKLLTMPILYLSRFFIANRPAYYGLLNEVTSDAAWEPWIEFVLTGVEETASWTLAKVEAIHELYLHTIEHLQGAVPRTYSRELVDVIFEQPYARIGNVVVRGIAKRQTASRYLHLLADAGVLQPVQSGREVLFVHPKLLRLLTSEGNHFEPYEG
jgi:Fic family protein